jgi:hypothetical protein
MTTKRRIHLCQLLGRRVYDPSGRCAGRVREIRADRDSDGHCVVREYLLGRAGLLESLSVAGASVYFIHWLGGHGPRASHKVPWDKMDLSDPERPRISCGVDELETLQDEKT